MSFCQVLLSHDKYHISRVHVCLSVSYIKMQEYKNRRRHLETPANFHSFQCVQTTPFLQTTFHHNLICLVRMLALPYSTAKRIHTSHALTNL